MSLYIKMTRHGRGMFSKASIKKGDIFDIAPVILIPQEQGKYIKCTELDKYVYEFGRDIALALGYGSLYNHSSRPNAEWYINSKNKTIYYRALRDIPADKEIRIDYGYNPKDRS